MPDIILTERQLRSITKKIQEERQLNESSGWNTFFDIVGIFDPTGVVDLGNGISYLTQGDYLFGFLSVVSAVPYLGDLAAKPLMGALKVGGPAVKGVDEALKLSKLGKETEALAMLDNLKGTPVVGKFIESSKGWGGTLKRIVGNLPGGLLKGFRTTLLDWISLFEKSAAGGKLIKTGAKELSSSWKTLSSAEKIAELEKLKVISKDTGLFTKFRNPNMGISSKYIFGGMPQLIGRNRSVRSLMRRSKWWLGFLDWIGLGNWVGPDEIAAKMGEEEFVRKMEQYNQTPQAKQNFSDQFQDGNQTLIPQAEITPNSVPTPQIDAKDPIQSLFSNMFSGNLRNAAALML